MPMKTYKVLAIFKMSAVAVLAQLCCKKIVNAHKNYLHFGFLATFNLQEERRAGAEVARLRARYKKQKRPEQRF